MAYHKIKIQKEKIGTIEKIYEEFQELKDAHEQGNKILFLIELSDIIGALKLYIEKLNVKLYDSIFNSFLITDKPDGFTFSDEAEMYNKFLNENSYMFSKEYFQEIKNNKNKHCLMIMDICCFIEYVLETIYNNVMNITDVWHLSRLTIESFKDGTRK